jgi:outer membrane lipoprotein SlyB
MITTQLSKGLFSSAVVLSCALILNGCGAAPASNSYTTAQAGKLQEVKFGEVISVRSIMIEQNSSQSGQYAGGMIGGSAAKGILPGDGTSMVGSVTGAVVGSAVGTIIDRTVEAKPGLEITLKFEDGKAAVIVQLADNTFTAGQKVKIVTSDGISRVVPL